MVKYRDPKSITIFSRFLALSLCAWITIGSIAASTFFYFHHKLNFKTSFTQLSSYLTLYQQREFIFISTIIVVALFLLIIYTRLLALKCHTFIKILLVLMPTTFIIALCLLSFNLYMVISELNIPLGRGLLTLKKYLQNFSIDIVWQALTTLPYQLNSIKIPLYGVIYSYLAMFTVIIITPPSFHFAYHSWWKKLQALLIILFLMLYGISAYYLIVNFIIHDPFRPYEQLFQHL